MKMNPKIFESEQRRLQVRNSIEFGSVGCLDCSNWNFHTHPYFPNNF